MPESHSVINSLEYGTRGTDQDQIILLVLLISFVTSIATGIVTVSLLALTRFPLFTSLLAVATRRGPLTGQNFYVKVR